MTVIPLPPEVPNQDPDATEESDPELPEVPD